MLITGGTRGVGRAATLKFAAMGAHVVTCHRKVSDEADSLVQELEAVDPRHRVVRADLRVESDVEHLASVCRRTLGTVDVVVNNAGVLGESDIENLPLEEWYRVLDTNVTAQYLVLKSVLPILSLGASIINVGASAAMRGKAGAGHYTASKSAVIGLTRSLAKELGSRNIRVNTVAPGIIDKGDASDTPPQVKEKLSKMTSLGRLGTVDDVVGSFLFLASDLSQYISGATLDVDGGI